MKTLGLAILVLWLLASVPAGWALYALQPVVAAGAVSGTAWAGKAGSLMVAAGGQWLALGRSEWTLRPMESLRARALCFRLRAALAEQEIQGVLCSDGANQLQVPLLELALPAAATQQPGGLQLAGSLLVRIEDLTLETGTLQGLRARGSWQGAAVHDGRSWIELGNLGMQTVDEQTLTGLRAGMPEWHLFDAGGPLQLDLRVGMDLQGQLRVRGDIEVQPDAPAALQRSLAYVARSQNGNRYRLDL